VTKTSQEVLKRFVTYDSKTGARVPPHIVEAIGAFAFTHMAGRMAAMTAGLTLLVALGGAVLRSNPATVVVVMALAQLIALALVQVVRMGSLHHLDQELDTYGSHQDQTPGGQGGQSGP